MVFKERFWITDVLQMCISAAFPQIVLQFVTKSKKWALYVLICHDLLKICPILWKTADTPLSCVLMLYLEYDIARSGVNQMLPLEV